MSKKRKQFFGQPRATDHLSKATDVYVFVMLAVFPLLIGPYRYYKFNVFKFGSCLLLFAVYIAGLTLIALRSCGSGYAGRPHGSSVWDRIRHIGIPRILLITYLLWGIFSAARSPYGSDCLIGQARYEGLLSMLMYGGIFLFVSAWGSFGDKIIKGIAVSSLILSGIAVFQEFGSGFLYPPGGTYAEYIFLSTIGHIDCYAGMAAILLPVLFCSYVFRAEQSLRFRAVELISIFFLLYTFLFSDVDSGKIALPAAFIVALPFFIDTEEHLTKAFQSGAVCLLAFALHFFIIVDVHNGFSVSFYGGGRFIIFFASAIVFAVLGIWLEKSGLQFSLSPALLRRIAVIIIVILIIAMLIYIYNYSGAKILFKEASELMRGHLSDEAGNIRGYIWKASWDIISTHSILGSGPGTFFAEFAPYNEGYQRYAPQTVVDFAHNDFLQIGVCVGIVGLLIYVAFVASLFARALFGKLSFKKPSPGFGKGSGASAPETGARRPAENDFANRVILISGIAGYLAHSFFSFSIAIVTPLFWVLAGLLVAEAGRK